ncbi:hypothetical protein Desor_4255 [Desulfosporosinus orientis DSM 765]|uniref:Uncharacterized protein n=1 Tax=Desulfosporosinus orientis (strain ATCC 19365 / DSM 765 / NCIMB 8382 / VKM B-1628 / Singapore I) TaxID=768706 RepID=G7WIW3_DESOD|nr:hypothetical protein [Desulfosporosinus orientis]AET69688.1 hypothetical protein Desor_4255 [Desulfosporosinus orientis DSM 765]
MSKRNIVIGVTPVEFDNMPDSLKGKYTLAVEGVSDLYNKMSNEWVEERKIKNLTVAVNNKCNMQKAISIAMTNKCVSLEALSILMRIGRKPVLMSLANKSGIPHSEYRVKNKVLYSYTLLIFDTLEDAVKMAEFYVDRANNFSSVLERCSYETTGLL